MTESQNKYFTMTLSFHHSGKMVEKKLSVTDKTCDLIVAREKQYIIEHYNVSDSMITVQRGLF